MSTVAVMTGRRVRDPQWRGSVTAGVGALGGLALVLAGRPAVGISVAAFGASAGLVALVPVVRRARPATVRAAVAWAGILAWALNRLTHGTGSDGSDAVPDELLVAALILMVLSAIGGVVVIAHAIRPRLGSVVAGATWRDVTGTSRSPVPGVPWRAGVGVFLIGFSAVLGLWIWWPAIGANPGWQLTWVVFVFAMLAVIVGAPFAVAAAAHADRRRVDIGNTMERNRIAAHLHDSVLQTLALVQRQADDPVAVARLARRQEQSLRAWLAGESDLVGGTLVGALHSVVATVEEEWPPLAVEAVAAGDRALDLAAEALVAATREVLRNAGRHAPGAPVHVFVQADARGAEVFVRDEGEGFDPRAVPDARRGLRDAVVGRMEAVGGSAIVDARPGEGTEVTLRIGPPA